MINHFVRSLAFAADKHKNQRRKDAQITPYINHPCWDADRLDLGRVGIFPSAQYLSQEASLFIDLAYDWSTQESRGNHVR